MRIAVAQQAATADVAQNLAVLERVAAAAARAGADLLVTPELFTTGYDPGRVHPDPTVLPRVADLARRSGLALVVSEPHEGAITAVVVDRDGTVLGRYVKTHLYGPAERAAFRPGDGTPLVVEVAGLRVGVLVCFDVEFPETVRGLALAGADVVVVPTAILDESVARVLLPARAYENRVALAYANHHGLAADGGTFSGGSLVVGPDGEVLAAAGAEGEALLVVDVDADDLRRAREVVDYLPLRRAETYRRG
ncbi:nitrilase-related carbon-nitrogen hydrolase [Kineococcus radiotolerans]|uniref:Nitrilase/cyanide hydratase and apolipoprotein N-acyltransferase n=1 Tax=Kineococcus radiotolerans (strain ATCC BAA-149 / DSM 14245 / SRS30216) TaxID=266940 RepID=A6W7Y4_KINRD|nr:nitrilase-related carbon-nitrogen hydrolase [Kineococcus radiotolerans]ABS02923.1 Nitrilase/cyanide hydratase and apolipoprotein N-acyltransferase [Kineococcus radiotolerans SRS30216 = ATCC BAA-149]